MTGMRPTFIAAIGFLAAGLLAAVPASAGSLKVAKPAVTIERAADLHLVDRGSWHKKRKFKKHFRDYDDYYRGHDFKRHKKKRLKRAYRRGFDEGYYEGRYGRGYRDYGRYYEGPRYRRYGKRHHHHRGYRGGYRFGNGYIKTPGIYFRF